MKCSYNLVFLFLIIQIGFYMHAQNQIQLESTFVRLFDLQDNKIGKGRLNSAWGDTLYVMHKKKVMKYLYSNIGKIKTKRSGGHNVAIGAASGAVIGVIVGAGMEAAEDEDSWDLFPSSAVLSGSGLFFGAVGAGIGGVTALIKNSKTIYLNGGVTEWESFISSMAGNN